MLPTLKFFVFAASLAASTLSMAAGSSGLTRAEVQAKLVSVEQSGFNPSATDLMYPQGIERAQARVNLTAATPDMHTVATAASYSVATAQ